MACRRRRPNSRPDTCDRHVPNNMDQLAFKYMEMCKVDTDSDSEISPRCSDTSTLGRVRNAPQNGTLCQTLPLKPAARHGCYSMFLDPYDGSSEDSDEPNISAGVVTRTKQLGKGGGGGGYQFSGRSRRFFLHHPASVADVIKTGVRDPVTEQEHLLDTQMTCGSDSEVWVCELNSLPSHSDMEGCRDLALVMTNDSTKRTQTMDTDVQLDDSGLQATMSSTPHTSGPLTPVGVRSSQVLDSSSERSPSPCNLRSNYKRKLGLPGADVAELVQSKRQCVVNMEDEQDGVDSASARF